MQKIPYTKDDLVAVVPLATYDEGARAALECALDKINWKQYIAPGMRVAIKANLVSAMKPDEAATTHPTLICALVDILKENGNEVVIGDSPGGLYNSVFVGRVYNATGMHEAEAHGASLNKNYSQSETKFPDGKVLKDFTYTSYLDDVDVIINFAKLKSHGMMGMSACAKNMFGTIPGIIKPEYHYRFPNYDDFADMIVDLDEYFKPVISIADAVVGMEGNGPTAGTPRRMGCIIASHSPHNADMICAKIIGFTKEELPMLMAAHRRGLVYDRAEDVPTVGAPDELIVSDFERVIERRSMEFAGDGKNKLKVFFAKIASRLLRTKPVLKPDMCVGCGVCANICPAKAIVISKKKKAVINRKLCIRCFCCQEFCPKSALKVHRAFVASLFHKKKSQKGK